MEVTEAYAVFKEKQNQTLEFINKYDDPQHANAAITSVYWQLSKKDPTFLWFQGAAIASNQVGKNILASGSGAIIEQSEFLSSAITNNTPINTGDLQILYNSLIEGNKTIFENIIPLYLTYQEIGIEGLNLLHLADGNMSVVSDNIFDAFVGHNSLSKKANDIANELGLEINDPSVTKALFADEKNLDCAYKAALFLIEHEQNIVQKMYQPDFTAALKNEHFTNIAELLKLTGVTVGGQYYSFAQIKDPSDISQRMEYFKSVLSAIKEQYLFPDTLKKFLFDVDHAFVDSFNRINPYHFDANSEGGVNNIQSHRFRFDFIKPIDSFLTENFIVNQEALFHNNTDISFIDNGSHSIFPSVFSGEKEISKITIDPLATFLSMNPSFEVIAETPEELLASSDYFKSPWYYATALSNPQLPYLNNSTYIVVYDVQDILYYPIDGEVRGITFPFIFDTNTGVPLTVPLFDDIGHYSHESTIDILYSTPELFNTPGHINWYNPYWYDVVAQAKQQAITDYHMNLFSQSFMHFMTAGITHYSQDFVLVEYHSNNKINMSDVFYDSNTSNFGNSSLFLSEGDAPAKVVISSIQLADGTLLERNDMGGFSCSNCSSHTQELEQAANAFNYIHM
ncbi:hypothetical protein CC99x_012855 [Candidatus Berkiella cookevillensis]|uniref:Uncharacterized protein n=1 Tax=Candidatus Berkiella cookevillensis TaxID=437022 RepID=A0A0Q9Y9J9_9GAMM|nr:hypothetical protein [Candidatus Berkiella cookevillensis]MCS5709789.1 hypothetical protein [Candidatus Berkiella cookevillensis]